MLKKNHSGHSGGTETETPLNNWDVIVMQTQNNNREGINTVSKGMSFLDVCFYYE